ncbi:MULTISPECIES: TrmH family RNA methyltransferase [unclassified Rhodococcus (in: high G+C Gram-positive bacteria)]|uniref:TrmH family RNA methyltransferase n=1 Tax=unclassified Rhodococcus (in: high G+C Gram-positive bacteria) TaxID=192944 RepID=UPI0005685A07|nr:MULTISPECIES: RNA methyltransferase [unclassified Rhodococcus (in: high G+C Gram-positive bacteria)]KQU31420.1 RNA methyltransferase [Rhodococcus sp. Leaf225]KQU41674.1 RNA methyltransferase [Rhodococcus sp. Leaf258]MBY6678271.1 RNA methyltransferase [Rhodococcus sp. BP-332]MBY6681561.1 RNA methyltransferase [Rhodococcus sp. BP-316]MBY6708297.1 RNA methyltransferase [Rhodococcus sp. BP-241]
MRRFDDTPSRPAAPLTERTPRVVSAVKLQRGVERRRTGLFLAEGENAVTEAVAAGVVREVFATERWFDEHRGLLEASAAAGAQPQLMTERAAKSLSDTVTPPGIVAVCTSVVVSLAEALAANPSLVTVVVDISEPGNAGTILRVSDAAGAGAVIFAGDSVDPLNGKSVRASAGSLFHLPVARERSVTAVLDAVRATGASLLATTVDGELDLDDADDALAGPTAWVFGNEAHGLSREVAAAADHRVRIPIHGRAESLNLATAAAVCLYAGARVQRRGGTA